MKYKKIVTHIAGFGFRKHIRFLHRWFSIDNENRPFSQVAGLTPFNVYAEVHRIVQK